MHLVVGLGNPGDRYASTRHNVAWRVLDTLAARHGAREAGKDTTWRAREASIAGQPTVLLQPLTFMNLSGEALGSWRERRGREEQLLVVSDDVYLPLGFVRIRATGSSGANSSSTCSLSSAALSGPGLRPGPPPTPTRSRT